MAYTQQNRMLSIETPLGEDTLLLQSFSGVEGISRLFSLDLELLSENPAVNFDKIVGQRSTIRVLLGDREPKYINGFISRFTQGERSGAFTRYRAQLVPWLWFLTRKTDCRIFQNMAVPDILEKIFRELGFTDFRNALQKTFEPREYCVQYRETDFNFVSRLMEQYGIFYFFEHESSKHTLVFADSAAAHVPCPGQAKATVGSREMGFDEDVITSWEIEHEFRPGKYALSDYSFETPATDLTVGVNSKVKLPGIESFEVYEYPGEYEKKAEGEQLVKIRMEEEEAAHLVVNGSSGCRGFSSGYKFNLVEHYRRDVNTAYVLTEVQHAASAGNSYEAGRSDEREVYTNKFKCIPHAVAFRPARSTAKPAIQGYQTAVVVGKAGEEIWVDKFGRVKVQFHWDREGTGDEKSSCWIRVATIWAGKQWGTVHIPRVGQEVVVGFEEGDPDRPIILGSVYNAVQLPAYGLPSEQTRSGIKSMSSKGGGGFNEIRFEDKKGSEQLFVQSERQMDLNVKKSRFESIGESTHLTVARDQLEKISGDKHLTVTGDHNQKVTGTASLKVDQDHQEKVGQKYALDAGMEIHLKSGVNLMIESGTALTLKVGGNFINLNASGVYIQGTMVMINSGGAAGSASGSSPQAPTDPTAAEQSTAGQLEKPAAARRPPRPVAYSPAATAMREAAQSGTPFCDAAGS